MTPEERDTLFSLADRLSASDLAVLTRFARFLLSEPTAAVASPFASVPAPTVVPDPENIPRPSDEKVVAAVKRLSKTYFMLDKKKMLGVTSDLVTQHILQGRDAVEVIDELENLFQQHYEQLRQGDQHG
jgi:hypothetical protein